MVKAVQEVAAARGKAFYGAQGREKDNLVFRRSIFAVRDIAKGDTFSADNVRVIRPGHGLLPKYYDELLGKKAAQGIMHGEPLSLEMILEKHTIDGAYLRKAGLNDMDLLFRWANDDTVRENAFTTGKIAYEDHKKWFAEKTDSDSTIIYIYCHNDTPIGQTRIDFDGYAGLISYSIDSAHRRQGHAGVLLTLLEYVAETDFPEMRMLVAQVKKTNITSQRRFEKCRYSMTEKEGYFEYHKKVGDS